MGFQRTATGDTAGKGRLKLLQRFTHEFERTFAAIISGRAASLFVLPDPLFSAYTARIADLAGKSFAGNIWIEGRCRGRWLIGLRYADLYRRAAGYVDKISKGARPSN